jgi:hypothetical protein
MDNKTKRRFLDNLNFAKNELENLQSDRGFKDYHNSENHDEIIKKIYDVTDHIEDVIEELEGGQ